MDDIKIKKPNNFNKKPKSDFNRIALPVVERPKAKTGRPSIPLTTAYRPNAVPNKTKFRRLKNIWQSWVGLSLYKKILVIALFVVFFGLIGYTIYKQWIYKAPKTVTVTKPAAKVAPPKPTTELSTLTGLQVPIGTNDLPVTGVMIENSPDARPQAGLKDAGVIFEAVAEGGITRFLALYQSDSKPDYIGPIRSVRPYYLDFLGGFDAAVAHVGGSPEAIAQIRDQGIKDLDQFYNSGVYRRVNSRYAPHNVYSSIGELTNLQKQKGFKSQYIGIARKGKDKALAVPTAKSIDITISGNLYNVHYDYNPSNNSYQRNLAGRPHMEDRDGGQQSPKVVVVMVVNKGIASDGIHTTYQTIGSGKVYIFQDGDVIQGIWEKSKRTEQLRFGDANGAPLAINPGQVWISLVGTPGSVEYKP